MSGEHGFCLPPFAVYSVYWNYKQLMHPWPLLPSVYNTGRENSWDCDLLNTPPPLPLQWWLRDSSHVNALELSKEENRKQIHLLNNERRIRALGKKKNPSIATVMITNHMSLPIIIWWCGNKNVVHEVYWEYVCICFSSLNDFAPVYHWSQYGGGMRLTIMSNE